MAASADQLGRPVEGPHAGPGSGEPEAQRAEPGEEVDDLAGAVELPRRRRPAARPRPRRSPAGTPPAAAVSGTPLTVSTGGKRAATGSGRRPGHRDRQPDQPFGLGEAGQRLAILEARDRSADGAPPPRPASSAVSVTSPPAGAQPEPAQQVAQRREERHERRPRDGAFADLHQLATEAAAKAELAVGREAEPQPATTAQRAAMQARSARAAPAPGRAARPRSGRSAARA